MTIGPREDRLDRPGERILATLRDAFGQVRMRRYPPAGIAHFFIFYGFIVLLLRSLILWGRGFDPSFDMWLFGLDQPLGKLYSFFKDIFVILVIVGTLVFVYYRLVRRLPRMTLSVEGLVILGIILAMMFADLLYDGAWVALRTQQGAVAAEPSSDSFHPESLAASRGRDFETSREVRVVGLRNGTAVAIYGEADEGSFLTGDDSSVPLQLPQIPHRHRMQMPEEWVPPESFCEICRKNRILASAPLLGTAETSPLVWYEPAGSVVGAMLVGLSPGALTILMHVGFWTHSALVLIFLNLLPYSKHFHIITAVPNVYMQNLSPARLPTTTDMDGKLERGETLGIRRIDQFSWKAILDFYTCTECGRCSDYCPATNTGKRLSPKHFTLDLRDFLYKHERGLVGKANGRAAGNGMQADAAGVAETASAHDAASPGAGGPQGQWAMVDGLRNPLEDLVPDVIAPEVLWACTTCRACEQECPVFISYVDKIVDMRRYLVQEKGEFATELQGAFRGLETNSNPWNFPSSDRAAWAEGLEIKTLAEHPEAAVLFWVGCMPSFDERAKKVAQATAKLMQQAGVDFAILGLEETCTGDPARRAGNEYLFQMMARQNVEVLNNYGAGKKKIVTTCPHCFNTLLNEYPDFGGKFDVVHHTTFLAELVRAGKLRPSKPVDKRVVFHDSCYLGRYNEVYDAPREALRSIPGLTVLEPKQTRDRGMCCGAGGAQMFKEEEHGSERVNIRRTEQLLATNPDAVSSACPFCQRMLTDGLAAKGRETVPQLDVAELLLESTASTDGS